MVKKSHIKITMTDVETEYKHVIMCQNKKCGAPNSFEWCFENIGCKVCRMVLPLGLIMPDHDLREKRVIW